MKYKFDVFIKILILALIVIGIGQDKESCMGVEYNNTNQQYVRWTVSTLPSARSYLMWVDVSSNLGVLFQRYTTDPDEYFGLYGASGVVYTSLRDGGLTNYGQWSAAMPSLGKIHFAVTYDDSSNSNDPLIYINGSSVTVTEDFAPLGTPNTTTDIILGDYGASASNKSPTGQILSFALYDRILSAQEIADAYASRLAIPTHRGLVFAPLLCGVSGGAKDGDTMTGSNQIADMVSGAKGTQNNSPVFRADSYLIWGGE